MRHRGAANPRRLLLMVADTEGPGPVGNAGWAFGGGMPMGGGSASVPPGAARQIGGGNVSFAQSLTGSQPATPFDLS